MLRTGLFAALLAGVGLGSTAMASDHVGVYVTGDFGGYHHVDDRWRGDRDHDWRNERWEGRERDWDRRDWERREWERREWARRDWERREWDREHRRYWDGQGWVIVGAAPYYGWHWDAYRGRWCP